MKKRCRGAGPIAKRSRRTAQLTGGPATYEAGEKGKEGDGARGSLERKSRGHRLNPVLREEGGRLRREGGKVLNRLLFAGRT